MVKIDSHDLNADRIHWKNNLKADAFRYVGVPCFDTKIQIKIKAGIFLF